MSFEANQSFPKMKIRQSRQEFSEALIKSESSFSYGWPVGNSILTSNNSLGNSKCNTTFETSESFIGIGFDPIQSRHIWNPNKLILCMDKENKVKPNTFDVIFFSRWKSSIQHKMNELILNTKWRNFQFE